MDHLKPAWIRRSDVLAEPVATLYAVALPESASMLGLATADAHTTDMHGDWRGRIRGAAASARESLLEARPGEHDPLVREDIDILLHAVGKVERMLDVEERHLLDLIDVPRLAFTGMRVLLDDQSPRDRKRLALTRLRRYAGVEPDTVPLAVSAEAETRRRMSVSGLTPPYDIQVRTAIALGPLLLDGIGELLQRSGLTGWEEPYRALRAQCAAYDAFLAEAILPLARSDHRLPDRVYATLLEQVGVDIPPAELAARAHEAFDAIQAEMQVLARRVAAERGFASGDYRDVVRELKREQIRGDADAVVAFYRKRLEEIETIVARERLLTLPKRAARIRVASLAESAQTPAAHMNPAPLVNNTGQVGEFVLPLDVPPAAGVDAAVERSDDFTHDAVTWTLTAHEARPGHEVQFERMLAAGLSLARAAFAFNSVNVEGWALYAEHVMLPYMPPAGQLCSLLMRLHRAARAFLDPELQSGAMTPASVQRFLERELVYSSPFARSEVERYTFRSPGQATSYFYGYGTFVALRAEVEAALDGAFDPCAFHDFILDQGLLPPGALRTAVMERFVPSRAGRAQRPAG